MGLTVLSTTDPQTGEEQQLSSAASLVSSWTTLDISAAFPAGKVPYSTTALIIIGADLPRDEHLIESKMLGKFLVRKFGDSIPPEEASGITRYNLSNETSVIYRDDEEYQSGGFLATLSIPVDSDGKFEYQFQNDSVSPRTIIRLLKVITAEEVPDSIPVTEKGVANGVASLNSSTLVVENPANATVTPTVSKIPIADGSGKLDDWVSIPSVPPAFEVIDMFTVEVSHTGDTLETVLHTAVVSANKMGAKGAVRLYAFFRAARTGGGTGNHTFKVYFGGQLLASYTGNFANLMLDMTPRFIWNQGATNVQGSNFRLPERHIRAGEAPYSSSKDTTADVDITFTVKNAVAAHTAYLRFALVEVYHQD